MRLRFAPLDLYLFYMSFTSTLGDNAFTIAGNSHEHRTDEAR